MEGRIYGRNDRWRKDQHLGRRLFASRRESCCEKRQESLYGEDGVEKMRVEEIGETGRWNGCYRGRLVAERGDEYDRFQGEVVGLSSWYGGVRRLQVLRESLDRGASAGRL